MPMKSAELSVFPIIIIIITWYLLEWPKQQHHHEDHYSQSKYEQNQRVL